MPNGGTPRTRRLGRELIRLREAAELELAAVAVDLRKSAAEVAAVETGGANADWPVVAWLLSRYVADEDERATVRALWQEAGGDGSTDRGFSRAVAEATSLAVFGQVVVPRVLRTPDYAEAADLAAPLPLPAGSNAVHVVVDESAVLRLDGAREVEARQLHHLVELAARPGVTLQVLPLRAGARRDLLTSFTILGFPDQPHAVHHDGDPHGRWTEDDTGVASVVGAFTEATRRALPPAASTDLIRARTT